MRDRQDEALEERIEQPEGHFVVVVAAIHRLVADVAQRVVHPAHVPFVREAKPARVCGAGHTWPRGRFLGDQHRPWNLLGDHSRKLLQEIDRFEILPSAIAVRDPLAFPPRIVAVEHRGDRVDTQPVGMEMLEPKQRAANQEAAHLVAAEIIDVGVPLAVHPLARIEMLIERGAIEPREPVRVVRKMGRHPVEDNADPAPHGSDRRNRRSRRATRVPASARTGRAADIPRSRRNGCSITGRSSTCVKPRSRT